MDPHHRLAVSIAVVDGAIVLGYRIVQALFRHGVVFATASCSGSAAGS